MRPVTLGRKNWLVADSLRARERAVAAIRLTQLVKLNGRNPRADHKDVMTRMSTHKVSRIGGIA